MEEANICEIDYVAIDENGVFTNADENSGFDCRNNLKLNGLCNLLKCYLVKFAIDGADRMFKDRKFRKTNSFAIGLDEGSMLHDTHQVHHEKYKFAEKRNKVNTSSWNKEYMNASKVVNSSAGGIIEFPLNVLAFFSVLLIKFAGFQFNLFVSFLTFPVRWSYSSVLFFLFPFQTLRLVRGYLVRKLLRMLGVSGKVITGKAIGFAWACFSSIYVCFMLLGLLTSGFLFGGILMKYLVEKPIQATETLNFDYTKSSPVAFVPIMSCPGMGDPSSLIVKDNVETGKDVSRRAIPYNHKLQLAVSLTVPESEYNRKLGVFQVRVEFLSAYGKITGSSSKPCMLKFKSQSIHFFESIMRSAPLIAGVQSEFQILNIKMNEFTEAREPTACLKVLLEQRAEYRAGAGIPEIYAASLAIKSELPPLKKTMWSWRRTIFIWTSFTCFATELLIVIIVCRSMIIPRGRPKIVHTKKVLRQTLIHGTKAAEIMASKDFEKEENRWK